MDKILEQRFYDRWPLWFRGRHEGMRSNLMCYGFEHGNGWADLEWKLCEALEKVVKADYKIFQIKEKFGELRWYDENGGSEAHNLVREAQALSAKTCELCGKPGTLRGERWLSTMCDACWDSGR